KREHDALPHDHWGPASSYNYPTWMRGLLMDRRRFRQPILGLSPPFADLFCENPGSLLDDLPGALGGPFSSLSGPLGGLFSHRPPLCRRFASPPGGLTGAAPGRTALFGGLFGALAGDLGIGRPDRGQDSADLAGDVLDG